MDEVDKQQISCNCEYTYIMVGATMYTHIAAAKTPDAREGSSRMGSASNGRRTVVDEAMLSCTGSETSTSGSALTDPIRDAFDCALRDIDTIFALATDRRLRTIIPS